MTGAMDRPFGSFAVGDTASLERTIVEEDVRAFADLSGDYSPIHVDEEYASTTPLGGRVVHGMFLGALLSRLVGMQLPGKRALLVSESLEFKKPVHIGDTVTVVGTVIAASAATHIVELDIEIKVGQTRVAAGTAHVLVREA